MKYCVSIFNFIKRCQPVADQHPIIYINDYHVTLYSARPTEPPVEGIFTYHGVSDY